MARLPLEGIRVADFSWVINGPQVGLWLGAMGAEMIKIESMVYPDIFRRSPGRMADGIFGLNRCGSYHYLNYAKKAVNINLATPRGRELAYDIIRKSDFVLECFTTPHTRRLGLTYEELKAVKPDIIVISISLLGRTGPCADWVGWGPQACAFVGQVDAQGYPGPIPESRPRQTGGTWPDYEVGTAIIFMALAALHHRHKTGQGQHIDSAMSEVVAGEFPEWFMDYFMNGRERGRWANRDDIMAPHNTYRCKGDDKWVAIAVGSDAEWWALCQVMGNPIWAHDPKFADQLGRWKHSHELDEHITQWTKNFASYEVMEMLQRVGVAAGPVIDSADVLEDPHLKDRGYFWEMDHHEVGKRIMPGIPAKLSNVPAYNYSLPPDFGQHNEEVFLGLLGLPREEYERLKEEKVIY